VVTGQADASFLYGSMSVKIDIVTQKCSFSGRRLYSFEILCGIGLSTLAELEKGENDIRDEETPECRCPSHLICAFSVNRRHSIPGDFVHGKSLSVSRNASKLFHMFAIGEDLFHSL